MKRTTLICIALTMLFLSHGLVTAAEESSTVGARPDLTGQVLDANGMAVPEAMVFIFSGGPRVGSSSFCPTCYPDCRKHEVTDANGKFLIKSLDPKLLFRLLVVAKNYKPLFVPKTDPFKGAAAIRVEPRKTDFPPHQALRGRVVDQEGKPVSRAVVNFDFFGGQEANCGGQCDGVDLVAVSDEEGKFVIGSEKKFDWMTVYVEVPTFSRRKFFELKSEQVHELKMTEGALVTGRMVKDGKPMKGIGVGLVSVDRSETFTGNFDTFTTEDGRFSFLNVPPYQMYYVYSLMDSSDGDAIAPARRVRVTGDGSRKDVGDLKMLNGVRLRGKVVLSDHKPIPAHTSVNLGRDGAWDSRLFTLNPDGRFDVTGVPIEAFSLSLHVPGYRFSETNKSLDRLNGGSLVGRIESDTYLEIVLEPGDFQQPDYSKPIAPDAQPRDKPMMGALPANL